MTAPASADLDYIPIEVFEIAETDAERYDRKSYVGAYLYAKPTWCWNVPAEFIWTIRGDHPLCDQLRQARRSVIPVRAHYNGREWAGRVMDVEIAGEGTGEETWTVYCMSNLFWLMTMLGWVNTFFPAEVQVGLTGKQDIMFGPFDWVTKWFVARNSRRLDIPVFCKLPVRANLPQLPTLAQLLDIDELLGYVDGLDIVVMSSRFTYLDELFKNAMTNGRVGLEMELVIPAERIARGEAMPKIFNTASLAQLSSIINYTSDNFLNLSKLNNIGNLWNDTPTEPCYVYHSKERRDRREMVFQVAGGYITKYTRKLSHARASEVIVGGKAPEALNSLIEFGANLALQAIAGAITTVLGLGGVGAIAVGSLFDDIFFAFQHFFDAQLRADLGRDGFREAFADNTAAWTLDAFSVAMQKMAEVSGEDSFTAEAMTGLDGFEFGTDQDVAIINGQPVIVDMSHRRFDVGDIVNVYHRGTFVESWISEVSVEHTPENGRPREQVTFGDTKQKDMWGAIFDRLGQGAAATRALALAPG